MFRKIFFIAEIIFIKRFYRTRRLVAGVSFFYISHSVVKHAKLHVRNKTAVIQIFKSAVARGRRRFKRGFVPIDIANLTGEKYVLVFKEGKLLIDDYGKNSDVYNLNP